MVEAGGDLLDDRRGPTAEVERGRVVSALGVQGGRHRERLPQHPSLAGPFRRLDRLGERSLGVVDSAGCGERPPERHEPLGHHEPHAGGSKTVNEPAGDRSGLRRIPRIELEAGLAEARSGEESLAPEDADELLLIGSFLRRPPPELEVVRMADLERGYLPGDERPAAGAGDAR